VADNSAGVYLVDQHMAETYFGQSTDERFRSWATYKASICFSDTVSESFYNALLTGQVPIVPHDIQDLEEVVSPDVQDQLAIVRFEKYTAAAVNEAQAQAVTLFNQQGKAGVLRRHEFALKHTLAERIRRIVALTRLADESLDGSGKGL
jgi:hypothetical protein